MWTQVWPYISAVLPTVTAFLALLKTRSVDGKTDKLIIQTNGNINRLMDRNHQLAAELSKHGIPIPPEIQGGNDAGNS